MEITSFLKRVIFILLISTNVYGSGISVTNTKFHNDEDPVILHYKRIPTDAEVDEYFSSHPPEKLGPRTVRYYHANGKLKYVYTLIDNGCWVKSGEAIHYNENGVVTQKDFYDNKTKHGACDSMFTVRKESYFQNKKLFKQRSFKYYAEGGCECPCGKWYNYPIHSNTPIRNKFDACYNFKVNCDACKTPKF